MDRAAFVNEYSDEQIRTMGRLWFGVLGGSYPQAFAHRNPRDDWTREDVRVMLAALPDYEIIGMGF